MFRRIRLSTVVAASTLTILGACDLIIGPGEPDFTGTIAGMVVPSGATIRVSVIDGNEPEFFVTLDEDTRVLVAETPDAKALRRATPSDLAIGMYVRVWYAGAIGASLPPTVNAQRIEAFPEAP